MKLESTKFFSLDCKISLLWPKAEITKKMKKTFSRFARKQKEAEMNFLLKFSR